jgi:stearoyl-CoA desaturase (delta-9 desaturase)
MQKVLKISWTILEPTLVFLILAALITIGIGEYGLWPTALDHHAILKVSVLLILMTHITITAMSLSFHRMHTHQGVKMHPLIDGAMQIWLWCTTSMSKRDWVSVHIYHHAHSDTDLDPHSPKMKGLARIFFLGVYDYVIAKSHPDVVKLRKKIPENRLEKFIADNLLLGPIFMVLTYSLLLGPIYGALLSALTFAISPLFAVGGVNALAHYFGYKNHETTDNSRNLGFIFPLNWMICGELDHNNHHAHPKSCSFQHRWYEFDIGFFYLNLMSKLGLAELKFVYAPKKKNITTVALNLNEQAS